MQEIEVPEYTWKNEKRSRKRRCQGESGKIVNIYEVKERELLGTGKEMKKGMRAVRVGAGKGKQKERGYARVREDKKMKTEKEPPGHKE